MDSCIDFRRVGGLGRVILLIRHGYDETHRPTWKHRNFRGSVIARYQQIFPAIIGWPTLVDLALVTHRFTSSSMSKPYRRGCGQVARFHKRDHRTDCLSTVLWRATTCSYMKKYLKSYLPTIRLVENTL